MTDFRIPFFRTMKHVQNATAASGAIYGTPVSGPFRLFGAAFCAKDQPALFTGW